MTTIYEHLLLLTVLDTDSHIAGEGGRAEDREEEGFNNIVHLVVVTADKVGHSQPVTSQEGVCKRS